MGDRIARFWAAHGYSTAYYPLVITDSGHQFSEGAVDYHSVFKSMIDAELARPAGAAIEAYAMRRDDKLWVRLRLTNQSSVALSNANSAGVGVIVYEDAHVGVTNRYVRSAVAVGVPATLANGAFADFTLETPALTGVDWARLHAFVLADYIPGNPAGRYDMLQAALLTPVTFAAVQPAGLSFLIDAAHPAPRSAPLTVPGSDFLTWTATTTAPWLSVTPGSGSPAAQPIVTVNPSALAPGQQQAKVTIALHTSSGLTLMTQEVPAQAYLGPVGRTYLPLVAR